MIVQWCCKGVEDLPVEQIRSILTDGFGLACRFAQLNEPMPYAVAADRLTEYHLDLHVNHYDEIEPESGSAVRDVTPFISLSAGCIERSILLKTNVLHGAQRTALAFATRDGRLPGWVFTCYVLLSVNRATGISAVSEEIRELSHNRRYSDYHVEGEVAAKINVPSRQIHHVERWEPAGGRLTRTGGYLNLTFTHPRAVLDERRML